MQNPYIDENEEQPVVNRVQPSPAPATATYPYYQYGPGPQQPTSPNYSPVPGQLPPVTDPRAPVTSTGGRGLRTGAILALVVVLALVFGTGLFAGWQFGRTSGAVSSNSSNVATLQPGSTSAVTVPQLSGNNLEAVQEAVVAKVRPAVVEVDVTTQGGGAIGSGVIIDGRGYIVTNNHVVSGAQSLVVVLYDGTHLSAQLVGTDPADDLAVIKVTPPKNGLATLKLGDSSKLQVGQDVLAIGNPLGNNETVTSGIVSALERNVSEGQGGATLPDAIQTDAPINPGNSGGALVDLQGNLIGIPTLTAIDPEFNTPASGVGFAIPSN
ncbi:MAG TPA: trypsin-like peptidase domain-containing protein, partial [Ktedonobacteraceae bacterium]|nr:trypsin-like peptidase domain-containing protein [Ktedonobacteraceae bacterium]